MKNHKNFVGVVCKCCLTNDACPEYYWLLKKTFPGREIFSCCLLTTSMPQSELELYFSAIYLFYYLIKTMLYFICITLLMLACFARLQTTLKYLFKNLLITNFKKRNEL